MFLAIIAEWALEERVLQRPALLNSPHPCRNEMYTNVAGMDLPLLIRTALARALAVLFWVARYWSNVEELPAGAIAIARRAHGALSAVRVLGPGPMDPRAETAHATPIQIEIAIEPKSGMASRSGMGWTTATTTTTTTITKM